MQGFEDLYIRALRHLYDTEAQIAATMGALAARPLDPRLLTALAEIEQQSRRQGERLEQIFRVLYKEPRGQAAWAATALLREAWEASSVEGRSSATEACAAALLALKRYELTLYESLLRWSERCELSEALPIIRRSIAEELVQASVLAGFAFKTELTEPAKVVDFSPAAIH